MQDIRHEHHIRFNAYNYNEPFDSKSLTNHCCISSSMYGIVYLCILEIVIPRDYLKGYIRNIC